MQKIWKYTLEVVDSQRIEMPRGAELLIVAIQHARLQLWALVDTDQPLVNRTIYVVATGVSIHPTVTAGAYVGTALAHDGCVHHVFDGYEDDQAKSIPGD